MFDVHEQNRTRAHDYFLVAKLVPWTPSTLNGQPSGGLLGMGLWADLGAWGPSTPTGYEPLRRSLCDVTPSFQQVLLRNFIFMINILERKIHNWSYWFGLWTSLERGYSWWLVWFLLTFRDHFSWQSLRSRKIYSFFLTHTHPMSYVWVFHNSVAGAIGCLSFGQGRVHETNSCGAEHQRRDGSQNFQFNLVFINVCSTLITKSDTRERGEEGEEMREKREGKTQPGDRECWSLWSHWWKDSKHSHSCLFRDGYREPVSVTSTTTSIAFLFNDTLISSSP